MRMIKDFIRSRCQCRTFMAVNRLADAPAGSRFRITGLDSGNHETVQKMILMGALPGKSIEVIQRFPAFLVALGNSQFAIDRELAAQIAVRPWEE